MGHDHHHHHHHNSTTNLRLAFFLNLGFTIFEIIGGLYVNSVAIISDAVHDLGDTLSLGTAWYLQNKSEQKADKDFSFGYRRFSLFGALINCLVLLIGSIFVISKAVERFQHPEEPMAQGMMWIAIIGVAVNGYAAYKVSSGTSLNERVVSWHLMEDVLGWVIVLIASIILQIKYIPLLDPALSLFITAYILYNVLKNLKETLFLFLQRTPKDIDQVEIENKILNVPKVLSLHHTHIWSLDGEHHVFSTHVCLDQIENNKELILVKDELNKIMKEYPFEHFTIATELPGEKCGMMSSED